MSFYFSDKKGQNSISTIIAGIRDKSGNILEEKPIHISELSHSPRGTNGQSFRRVDINFNSALNESAIVYVKMKITDSSKIDMEGDISKQTEVRLDEFSLTQI
ncbi:hypothetical protein ACPV5R_00010 [Vibrio astriarenae]